MISMLRISEKILHSCCSFISGSGKFVYHYTILIETKCKFPFLITSKLWIFTLEKYFSLKLTHITHGKQNRLGTLKYNVWMGFDLPQYTLQCVLIELHTHHTQKNGQSYWQEVYGLHSDQFTLFKKKKNCIAHV